MLTPAKALRRFLTQRAQVLPILQCSKYFPYLLPQFSPQSDNFVQERDEGMGDRQKEAVRSEILNHCCHSCTTTIGFAGAWLCSTSEQGSTEPVFKSTNAV